MNFKTFFKKLINKNLDEPLSCEDNSSQANIVNNNEPIIYDLKNGVNEIIVKGMSVDVLAVIPDGKNMRIIVNPDGEILLFNYGGYGAEFNTSENLFITFAENNNPKFKLKGGSGHDKIVINEDVVLDELLGGDGNDEIINNGIIYHIYGGDGNDVILNNGIVNSIYGEDGDDTVVNNGMVSKYIDAGDGDDKVTNNSHVGRYITTGDGNDELVNNGEIAWTSTSGFQSMTGEINGILYVNGEKFSGLCEQNALMYQDGKPLTGVSPMDNKKYENGREVKEN